MAFWGKARWLAEGKRGYRKCPVLPWEEEKVESAGYRLSVGAEYFVNGGGESTVEKLESREGFVIEPGQFAFILTKEKVYISKSAIGFISIRASIKFLGLVNVSGFQVNPGFCGNLVFAVFNAGPKHVNLREGDEIFSLWIADLDATVAETSEDTGKIPNNLDKIPSDVINGIAGEALTAYQLSDQISELKAELQKIKNYALRAVLILTVVSSVVFAVFGKSLVQAIFPSGTATQTEQPVEQSSDGS